MSSSSTGYSLEAVSDFVEPGTKDLNTQGKWFKTRLQLAQGFVIMMWILGIIAAVFAGSGIYKLYTKRKADKAAENNQKSRLSASNPME